MPPLAPTLSGCPSGRPLAPCPDPGFGIPLIPISPLLPDWRYSRYGQPTGPGALCRALSGALSGPYQAATGVTRSDALPDVFSGICACPPIVIRNVTCNVAVTLRVSCARPFRTYQEPSAAPFVTLVTLLEKETTPRNGATKGGLFLEALQTLQRRGCGNTKLSLSLSLSLFSLSLSLSPAPSCAPPPSRAVPDVSDGLPPRHGRGTSASYIKVPYPQPASSDPDSRMHPGRMLQERYKPLQTVTAPRSAGHRAVPGPQTGAIGCIRRDQRRAPGLLWSRPRPPVAPRPAGGAAAPSFFIAPCRRRGHRTGVLSAPRQPGVSFLSCNPGQAVV